MIELMNNRIFAIVLLVVGGILLFFAYQSSQSMGDQITEAFTGRFITTFFLSSITGKDLNHHERWSSG